MAVHEAIGEPLSAKDILYWLQQAMYTSSAALFTQLAPVIDIVEIQQAYPQLSSGLQDNQDLNCRRQHIVGTLQDDQLAGQDP